MRNQGGWVIMALLVFLLAASGAAMVGSRVWLLEAHREMKEREAELRRLGLREQLLRVEWVARTDLNVVERWAKEEKGMRLPRAEQWRLVKP